MREVLWAFMGLVGGCGPMPGLLFSDYALFIQGAKRSG